MSQERCSCCWYEYAEDKAVGHSTELTHVCISKQGDDHPKADVMAVNTPFPAVADRVNIHRCACGVTWIERMKLGKRIQ